MRQFNRAMLSKQAWRIVTGEENICTQVLHSKYANGKQGLDIFVAKASDSPTWKGVTRQASIIE